MLITQLVFSGHILVNMDSISIHANDPDILGPKSFTDKVI